MKVFCYTVSDPEGIHALPAGGLVKLAAGFQCSVTAEGNGKVVDAKHVFGLMSLGVKQGLVVYGQDKLDEISPSAPTSVCDFKDGRYATYTIKPEDFGFERCSKEDIKGGDPAENAKITTAILKGEEQGPKRNAVLLNAGAALYAAGKAESMKAGVKLAAELIDSGKAYEALLKAIEVSNAK